MIEEIYKIYLELRIESCEGCKENWCSQKDHRCCTDLFFDDYIWKKAIKNYNGANNVESSSTERTQDDSHSDRRHE